MDKALFDEMIATRRRIHRRPEEGWTEFETNWLVVERLREIGGFDILLGTKVVNPQAVMGRSEKLVKEAIERALANGVPQSFIDETEGYTGCVAVLDTGRPGPVTTLRFDIDCLAIEELFDANKLDQKTLEATFARYNELTQPARTPTSAAASTRKQSRSAKRPSTSPK